MFRLGPCLDSIKVFKAQADISFVPLHPLAGVKQMRTIARFPRQTAPSFHSALSPRSSHSEDHQHATHDFGHRDDEFNSRARQRPASLGALPRSVILSEAERPHFRSVQASQFL